MKCKLILLFNIIKIYNLFNKINKIYYKIK